MINNLRRINISDFPENGNLESQIEFVLSYAILAPSTHNSQPWLFKIKVPECEIYYDPKLILPEADPKTRDLHVSIGCAIENLILAATYFNIFESINYGPFKDVNQLAYVRFKNHTGTKNTEYESILNIIPKRINARGLFSSDQVPNNLIDRMSLIAKNYLADGINLHWINNRNKIIQISTLTANGLRVAYGRPEFRREMSRWIHHSLARKKDGLPGYALKMPLLASFILPNLIKWFDLGSLFSRLNYISLSSAPLIAVITAEKDSASAWLSVGRLAERLMLELNNAGWQTSIFVAAIEMGDFYKEVQSIISTDQMPQFLFAVGKINSIHRPTPRHTLIKKIIN